MGHFIIDLLENNRADVRFGTVYKNQFSFFRRRKISQPEYPKKGYIVRLLDSEAKIQYQLFKSKDGVWSKDPEGKMPLDNHTLIQIKNAIIKKESFPD
jgi:hypothetical protein